jgi:hypothetical protein
VTTLPTPSLFFWSGVQSIAGILSNAKRAKAHEASESGHTRGKIVLEILMLRSCCFERELGQWDTVAADRLLKSNASWSEAERAVERFTWITQGEIISLSGDVMRCSL